MGNTKYDSEFDAFIKKYKANEDKRKNEAANDRVDEAFLKVIKELIVGKLKEAPLEGAVTVVEKDLVKVLKTLKGFIKYNEIVSKPVDAITSLGIAYSEEIPPMKTPVEGLFLYSINDWHDFFIEFNKIQLKKIEDASTEEGDSLKKELEKINKLLYVELNRFTEQVINKEEYDKSRKIGGTAEYFIEALNKSYAKRTPIQKYKEKEISIKFNYDNERAFFSENYDQVNEFWAEKRGIDIQKYRTQSSNQNQLQGKSNVQKQSNVNQTSEAIYGGALSDVVIEGHYNKVPTLMPQTQSGVFADSIKQMEKDMASFIQKGYLDTIFEKIRSSVDTIAEARTRCETLYGYLNSNEKDSKRASIAKQVGLTEEDLKKIENSPEQIEKIKKAIESLDGVKLVKNPASQFISDIESGLDMIRQGGLENIGQGMMSIGGTIDKVLPQFIQLGNDIGTIFGEEVGKNITNSIQVLSSVVKTGSGVGRLLAGDVTGIFDVASGIAGLLGNSKKVNEEHRKAKELLEKQVKAQEQAYQLSLLRKDLNYDEGTTVFGSDAWGKATNAAGNYQQSLLKLKESTQELNNIDIVTGSRKSGWGPWKKQKDVYSDILSVYPDLIDGNEMLNKELALTVLNNRTMSDTSKAALQSMIDNAEQVEAAYAEMNNYLTGIFGSLGDQITDAFVDSFANGTNAMDNFTKSAGSMLEELVKDMVHSIAIAPIIQKANEQIQQIMKDPNLSDEDRLDAYINALDGLIDGVGSQEEVVNTLLGRAQESANEKGFSIFEKTLEGTTGKGVSTMTQESANELNGNFFALLQQAGYIRDLNSQSLLVQQTMQNQLSRVADNTEYCRYLENIKISLEDMQTRGVKVKV